MAQWQSSRGMTLARQLLAKLAGSAQVDEGAFFRDLWQYLLEAGLLRHVTLTGQRGNALPNTSGTAQVDADRFLLSAQSGLWRCLDCRRSYARPMPRNLCIRWRCNGQVVRAEEDGDDYDLRVLDVPFAMLRSREHSAQIPQDERERIERKFKSGHDEINTLVATPTLELGVDIGALDGVLMRNVPPAPANYWQRAGRAGRRHRMAVNLTYARPASHDRAYFDDPQKLLLGRIDPPSFNLKNDLMVRKHARAVVLSELRRLRVDSTLSQELRTRVQAALDQCFPPLVKTWLFDGQGNVRTEVYDVNGLAEVIMTHRETLTASVQRVFASQWPHADSGAVAPELLALAVDRMAADLGVVVRALRRRLQWALDQQARLSTAKQQKGALDPDEEALERRCSRLIRRLKGTENRGRSDSEGVDDTETFGVLALEGYLPGYGLDVGTIAVTHLPPPRGNLVDLQQWSLRRANGLALREHVPGNLVYANNHRFAPRFFQPQPEGTEVFQVDPVAEAVSHAGVPGGMATLAAGQLVAMPVCDVDLAHASTISDDEDFRFQLGVTVFGYEQ
ncbi:MAG: helicase, partial [Deltaproteobacteria bacterium]|nr:helicase [Deltaproteobacteria bacterium]